ncbi:MAG: AhpC/TSA family protein [Granulosicoccus sp.]|nr:AhpC/TSA family protein [Granulosicoccus sp.]
MSNMLMPDAQVPTLDIETVNGDRWTLADQNPQNFTMIVFYRGLHCPVCKAYLQKLEALLGDYQKAGFSVIAVSMNTADLAAQTASEWELSSLQIGHSLSEADARAWGLYISRAIKEGEADIFNEPGLFWIRPDGKLYLADVSNMPWSRPDLDFLHSKIPFAVENQYPARGGHTA